MRAVGKVIAKLLLLLAIATLVVGGTSWLLAGPMIESGNHPIGPLPKGVNGSEVQFASTSGAQIRGWLIPGKPGAGAIMLLHGVRADRTSMYQHARFLTTAGYTVLLFDFQAHGESIGTRITFGHLESRDASAALAFLRGKMPGERVGVIGLSMGGAAALLADPPLDVDAMVLEEVYPTIEDALADRLRLQYGEGGGLLVPLFSWQMPLRLNIGVDSLRPLDRIAGVRVPKLLIAGGPPAHDACGIEQDVCRRCRAEGILGRTRCRPPGYSPILR